MTRTSGGLRSRTRFLLRREHRQKFSVEPFLKAFAVGDPVAVDLYPASPKGMPHPRLQGRVGTVQERRGKAYVVAVPVGSKMKTVIARPEHLHRIRINPPQKAARTAPRLRMEARAESR